MIINLLDINNIQICSGRKDNYSLALLQPFYNIKLDYNLLTIELQQLCQN